MVRSNRERPIIVSPLSVHDDLGVDLEAEYQDLGDQGIARRYGSRWSTAQVIPELDNAPIFDTTETSNMKSWIIPASDPDALERAATVVREIESGTRQLGGLAFDAMAHALCRLVDAETAGADEVTLRALSDAALAARQAYRSANS